MKTSSSGGRPTKEQAAALDAAILDGARASFSEKGLSGTTIDELSANLNVSKHTIYRRYRNKTLLLEAVVTRDMEGFKAALEAAAQNAQNPVEALRAIAFRYVELGSSREHAGLYLSIMAEAARSSEMRKHLALWASVALQPLRDAIIQAQEAGLLRERDPELAQAIFIDLLEGANNVLRLGEDSHVARLDHRKVVEQRWQIFHTLMVNG